MIKNEAKYNYINRRKEKRFKIKKRKLANKIKRRRQSKRNKGRFIKIKTC